MGEIRELCKDGDNKVIWDPKNPDEVEVAKMMFDKLKAKSYLAFKVDKQGKPAKQISSFSSKAGKLIMTPPIGGG
jgi:hypothetical protein